MIVGREQVVEVARGHIGVPWRRQGRGRAGVDCLGLIMSVWSELSDQPPPDETGYQLMTGYRRLPEGLARHMTRILQPKPGCVLLLSQRGFNPLHLGVVTTTHPTFIVHAYTPARRVTEHQLTQALGLREVSAWDFPWIEGA